MTGKIMHQMRVWPPAWTRPLDDRPPYIIWPIGGLLVWVVILAVYMSLDHTYLSRVSVPRGDVGGLPRLVPRCPRGHRHTLSVPAVIMLLVASRNVPWPRP